MLLGLHKNWKQPVDFYLIHGSTKGEVLVFFVMEVLGTCHNVGQVVVGVVFDMGANSVKAF